jgi:HAD superfamily hydrolase (TIGR01509 family)
MIKAIIFDCFGVLAGSGFNETYRQAGGDVDKDAKFIKSVLHEATTGAISSQEFMTKVAGQIGITDEQWLEAVQKAEQPNIQLFEHIKQLKGKYKIAILSNANNGVMQMKFNPEQLELFDKIVVSAEVGMFKPDPGIYKLTADWLGVEPAECVFTDDKTVYCDGATAVGMQAIWYQNFDQFKANLEETLK